jgi:hypothetical protein
VAYGGIKEKVENLQGRLKRLLTRKEEIVSTERRATFDLLETKHDELSQKLEFVFRQPEYAGQ